MWVSSVVVWFSPVFSYFVIFAMRFFSSLKYKWWCWCYTKKNINHKMFCILHMMSQWYSTIKRDIWMMINKRKNEKKDSTTTTTIVFENLSTEFVCGIQLFFLFLCECIWQSDGAWNFSLIYFATNKRHRQLRLMIYVYDDCHWNAYKIHINIFFFPRLLIHSIYRMLTWMVYSVLDYYHYWILWTILKIFTACLITVMLIVNCLWIISGDLTLT